jgi:predicted transcriptional regulator
MKKNKVILIATLGFSPELIISEQIFDMVCKKTNYNQINLYIILPHPRESEYPQINNINKYLQNFQSIKIEIIHQFFFISIDPFWKSVVELIKRMNEIYKSGEAFPIFLNLSGGMKNVVLATYTASLFFPIKEAFIKLENSEKILKIPIEQVSLNLRDFEFKILSCFKNPEEKFTIKQIIFNLKRDFNILKDRSTIYRKLHKMIDSGFIDEEKVSYKTIYYTIKPFPFYYVFKHKN